MHVIERFPSEPNIPTSRPGRVNPNVLTKPFNMNPASVTLKLGATKGVLYNDDYLCETLRLWTGFSRPC